MDGMIVVGSDSSAPSRAAVTWAAQRAAHLSLSVMLCHAIEGGSGGPDQAPLEAGDALAAEARRIRSAFPGVDVQWKVLHGDPVAAIADVAYAAECIVVGTHKTGFIHGRVLQSRVAGIVHAVDVPVAFVPYGDTSHRSRVVAAIGASSSLDAVIRRAAAEAHRFGDELILLGSPLSTDSSDVLTLAATLASKQYPDLPVVVRIDHQSSSAALIDASLTARLLVIGRSTLPSRASVITDVLLNLSCPALIVRDPLTSVAGADGTCATDGHVSR